jgi:hypothetical protein
MKTGQLHERLTAFERRGGPGAAFVYIPLSSTKPNWTPCGEEMIAPKPLLDLPSASAALAARADKAGACSIEELEAVLQPLLSSLKEEPVLDARWPLTYSMPAIFLSCIGLWGLAISAQRAFF